MAHELAFKANGQAAMAYAGQTPWHGLGQQLSADADLDTWIREAGFDWEVKRAKISYEVRDDEDHPVCVNTVPNRWALYRSDNGNPLSVMSSNYNITQPRQVMEFFRDLTSIGGFKMETAGMLRDGATYWALAKADDQFDVGGGDVVLPYLLLATSCDGTLSNVAQFTTVRVVCQNTLRMSTENEQGTEIRIPHSTKFDEERVKTQLGLIGGSWERFKQDAKTLSKRTVSKDEAAKFFIDVLYGKDGKEEAEVARPMLNKIVSIYFDGVGQRTKTAEGTAWGLVNTITRFADHERKAQSQDTRLQAAWFGSTARLKETAWNTALALAA